MMKNYHYIINDSLCGNNYPSSGNAKFLTASVICMGNDQIWYFKKMVQSIRCIILH